MSIFESLTTAPPAFTTDRAAELLETHYGVRGSLSPLASERDQNYVVQRDDQPPRLLKFANVVEPAAVTEFQNLALLHIAKARPEFPVPRVLAAESGLRLVRVADDDGVEHSMRLLTWLDGVPLQHAEGARGIAAQTGTCLAELGLILRDFENPASGYPLLWDIQNASDLAELLQYLGDADLRTLCEGRLQRFEDLVKPELDALRKQVVHNDLNPSNMLVASDDVDRLTGIIDFGDMVETQLVNDVAVAAAYFCSLDDDPFADVFDFLAAYNATTPLTDAEMRVLPDLVFTRHLTTVMITHWRAALYPENRDYILRNEGRARNMLDKVSSLPADDVSEQFRRACQRKEDA